MGRGRPRRRLHRAWPIRPRRPSGALSRRPSTLYRESFSYTLGRPVLVPPMGRARTRSGAILGDDRWYRGATRQMLDWVLGIQSACPMVTRDTAVALTACVVACDDRCDVRLLRLASTPRAALQPFCGARARCTATARGAAASGIAGDYARRRAEWHGGLLRPPKSGPCPLFGWRRQRWSSGSRVLGMTASIYADSLQRGMVHLWARPIDAVLCFRRAIRQKPMVRRPAFISWVSVGSWGLATRRFNPGATPQELTFGSSRRGSRWRRRCCRAAICRCAGGRRRSRGPGSW